jgi:hypothetical protein
MRTCRVCKVTKPVADYYLNRGRPLATCIPCHRAKTKARYQADPALRERVKERALADYYAVRAAATRIYGGCCVRCGATERLEFDHIDGGGEVHRSREGHRQIMRRAVVQGTPLTDVAIQLLCRTCHAAKSNSQDHRRDALGRYA